MEKCDTSGDGSIDEDEFVLWYSYHAKAIANVENALKTIEKDGVVVQTQAIEKPLINILWIGTIIMIIGFVIATRRRYVEFVKMRDKGLA